MLLAEYEESFSTYTMRQFMEDYMNNASAIQDLSITSIKVLLVSLLNAFRDLTLMGIQVS
jgi:hypothetical protein